MLRRTAIPVLLALMASATVYCQPPTEVAKEMALIEPMLGEWEGSGQMWSDPNAEPIGWTARSSVRKVMGGHFVRDDTIITFEEAMMDGAELGFITHYGWDRENGRYHQVEVGSDGTVSVSYPQFAGPGNQTTFAARKQMGTYGIERWSTKVQGDRMLLVGEAAQGNGAFHKHVEGTLKRVKRDQPISVAKVGRFTVPGMPTQDVHPAMTWLTSHAGKYTVKGWYSMGPGQKQEFEGTESQEILFGGSLLSMDITGDDGSYAAWAAIGWDADQNRFRMVEVNSWGMCPTMEAWKNGDNKLVVHMGGTMMGEPLSARTTITFGKHGPVSSEAHWMSGAAEPFKSFEAQYTPLKQNGN